MTPAPSKDTWTARDFVNCRYLIACSWAQVQMLLEISAHGHAWLEPWMKTQRHCFRRSNPLYGNSTAFLACIPQALLWRRFFLVEGGRMCWIFYVRQSNKIVLFINMWTPDHYLLLGILYKRKLIFFLSFRFLPITPSQLHWGAKTTQGCRFALDIGGVYEWALTPPPVSVCCCCHFSEVKQYKTDILHALFCVNNKS